MDLKYKFIQKFSLGLRWLDGSGFRSTVLSLVPGSGYILQYRPITNAVMAQVGRQVVLWAILLSHIQNGAVPQSIRTSKPDLASNHKALIVLC